MRAKLQAAKERDQAERARKRAAVDEGAIAADEALLLEALLLRALEHPRIVRLVGLVSETAPSKTTKEMD